MLRIVQVSRIEQERFAHYSELNFATAHIELGCFIRAKFKERASKSGYYTLFVTDIVEDLWTNTTRPKLRGRLLCSSADLQDHLKPSACGLLVLVAGPEQVIVCSV